MNELFATGNSTHLQHIKGCNVILHCPDLKGLTPQFQHTRGKKRARGRCREKLSSTCVQREQQHAGQALSDTIKNTDTWLFLAFSVSNCFHLTFADSLSSLHPSPHGYQGGHMPQNHQGWEHSSRRVCRHRAWDRVCELRAPEQGWRWKVREAR